MPRPPRVVSETGYYHIVMRGCGHQVIFETDKDRSFFLKLLAAAKARHKIIVIAYALMDNHFHLVLNDKTLSLEQFMRTIGTSYAMYYNRVNGHAGHVFQGRYLSKPIVDNEQCLATVRYVLNNPLKAGLGLDEQARQTSISAYYSPIRENTVDTSLVRLTFRSELDFRAFLASSDESGYLDIPAKKVGDAELRREICRIAHVDSPALVKALPKPQRNLALSQIIQLNVSLRRIERETGISRYIIKKAIGSE